MGMSNGMATKKGKKKGKTRRAAIGKKENCGMPTRGKITGVR